MSQRQQTGPSGSGGSETLELQHESMLSQVRRCQQQQTMEE